MTKVVEDKIQAKSYDLDDKIKNVKKELMLCNDNLGTQIDQNSKINNEKIENLMQEIDNLRNSFNITEK